MSLVRGRREQDGADVSARQHERVDYRVPASVVRISGSRTTTTSSLTPRATYECTATATLSVQADTRSAHTLILPAGAAAKQKLDLRLMPDGRIAGVQGEVDVTHGAVLTAALTAAVTVGSAAAPLAALGPAGAAAAGALSLAAAAGAAVYTQGSLLLVQEEQAAPPSGDAPDRVQEFLASVTLEDLGIDARYGEQRTSEAEALRRYRAALLVLPLVHAQTALRQSLDDPEGAARALASLDRVLVSVRREAARAEAAYEAWQAAAVTTTTDLVDEAFFVDELPSSADVPELLGQAPAGAHQRLLEVAQELRVLVTCDRLGGPAAVGSDARPIDELLRDSGWLRYRVPRPAVLTTWRLSADGTTATREKVDRVTVVLRGDERAVDVLTDGDATLGVSFDESGALVQVTNALADARAERAAAIAALPAALKGAAEAGAALAGPFTREARSKAAQAQVDALKARRELDALRTPPVDPLGDLRDQVEQAELLARLAAAQHLAVSPSAAVTVVRIAD